ncbi:hypothetical protein pb186bvf_000492 [Paramecium bursaria]
MKMKDINTKRLLKRIHINLHKNNDIQSSLYDQIDGKYMKFRLHKRINISEFIRVIIIDLNFQNYIKNQSKYIKIINKFIMINKKVQIQMARIKKEVNQVNGIQGQLMVADEDKNPFHYQLFLEGPKGSLYENGKFLIDVHYHKDHPFMPPRIKFITPIQHINILDGRLYLLILKEDWSLAIIFQQGFYILQQIVK